MGRDLFDIHKYIIFRVNHCTVKPMYIRKMYFDWLWMLSFGDFNPEKKDDESSEVVHE